MIACRIPGISLTSCCVVLAAAAGSAIAAESRALSHSALTDAPAARPRLLERMLAPVAQPATCFVQNPTPEEEAHILGMYGALPPGAVLGWRPRFFNAGGNGAWALPTTTLGPSNAAAATSLTYSFPDDGTLWGSSASVANTLNASLSQTFGAGNDQGRELLRQALAVWRRWCGISYTEVADDNSVHSTGPWRLATRGDIRMGGIPMGRVGTLAYDFFPTGGGDMTINTDYFPGGSQLGDPSNTYRYLRNVVSHEHGHGLGFHHPTPCNHTKVMEPYINTNFDGLQTDDIRGGQRNYGDRFAGNVSAATAKNFGELGLPARSVIAPGLSTNGVNGPNGTGEDWFKFTLSTAQNLTITATPTGGSYLNGQQTGGCEPSAPPTVNAGQAGDLAVELRDASGGAIVQAASVSGRGVAETVNMIALPAGTYTVRVVDVGSNDAANQIVQMYDLAIRVGASKSAPVAIAGLNKRLPAGTTSYFYGAINSYATDTGPTGGGNSLAYAWDLDGDGTFETAGSQPTQLYKSNFTFPVTLRVTDANGLAATDQIQVSVHGATTTIDSVVPALGLAGTTVPITINGGNFKAIDSASRVTVAGTGVTVIGSPTVNPLGTQITGLSLQVASGAPTGPRTMTITNGDGLGTAASNGALSAAFTVTAPATALGACCLGDGACASVLSGSCPGVFHGAGVLCTAVSCSPQTGACCTGSTCTSTTQSGCGSSGQRWAGAQTVCNGAGNVLQPCCKADFDQNRVVSIDDLFSYLNGWLSGSASTDISGNGASAPTIDDFFIFLNSWLTGC